MRIVKFCLVLLILVISTLLVGSTSALAQTKHSEEVNVDVRPRGEGWDVTVTWHVKLVSIPEVGYSGYGSNWQVTANYPQPYISFYEVLVDNGRCGGGIDPVTGQYRFPNAGYAFVVIIFPPGTSDTIGSLARRADDCGQNGGTNFIGNPVITPGDYQSIVGSIWARIELPELQIKMNPGWGIVTVPAWTWLILARSGEWWSGTDPNQGGAPFGATVTIPLPNQTYRVEVLAEANWLLWDFADQSVKRFKKTELVGKPYPQVSAVQHPYNNAITYYPQVTIHYTPRYAWNGGSFTVLPDLFRESVWRKDEGYRVREAQVQLIAPEPMVCPPEQYEINCGKGGNP